MRDIQLGNDLVPSAIIPYKPSYRLNPQEHRVAMTSWWTYGKDLVEQSFSPYAMIALPVLKKDGS